MGRKKLDLAYFAGIFDGEGTIAVQRHRPKPKRYRNWYFRLLVAVSNTSQELIEKCAQILRSYGIKFPKKQPYVTILESGKPIYEISITDQPEQLKLLKLLENLVVAKKEPLDLAIKYLETRLPKLQRRDEKGRFIKNPYSIEELGLLHKIQDLTRSYAKEWTVEQIMRENMCLKES